MSAEFVSVLEAASSGSVEDRQAALNWLEQYQATMSVKSALELFYQSQSVDLNAAFFCLGTLETKFKTRKSTVDEASELASSMSSFLTSETAKYDSYPNFIKNKFAQVICILISEYNFILEWLPQIQPLDLFLRVCLALDEEIQLGVNTDLKENLKKWMIPIVKRWCECVQDSNSSVENKKTCLKLMELYISWIDINLIVNDVVLPVIYTSISTPEITSTTLRCFSGIVKKGMKNHDKLSLIEVLRLNECLENISYASDRDVDVAAAELISNIGSELCSIFLADESLAENSWRHLTVYFNIFYRLFSYEISEERSLEEDASVASLGFVSSLLYLFRKEKKRPDGCRIDFTSYLELIMNSIITQMKLPPWLDVSDIDLDEVNFEEKADDPDTFEMFLEKRRQMNSLLEVLLNVDESFVLKLLKDFVSGIISRRDEVRNFATVEVAVYLIYSLGDAKGRRAIVSTNKDKTDSQLTPMGELIAQFFMANDIINYSNNFILFIYLHTAERYAGYFGISVGNYGNFLSPTQCLIQILQAILGNKQRYLCTDAALGKKALRFIWKCLKCTLTNNGLSQEKFSNGVSGNPSLTRETFLRWCGEQMISFAVSDVLKESFPQESADTSFEVVGALINALDDVDSRKNLLESLISPCIQMLERLKTLVFNPKSPQFEQLCKVITALGFLGRGFTEVSSIGRTSNVSLSNTGKTGHDQETLFNTMKFIMQFMLPPFGSVQRMREVIRATYQKFVSIIGAEGLVFLEEFVKRSILSDTFTINELVELMSFLSSTMFQLKSHMYFNTEIFSQITQKVFGTIEGLLNLQMRTEDDERSIIDLTKSYIAYLISFHTCGMDTKFLDDPATRAILSPTLSKLMWIISQNWVVILDPSVAKFYVGLCMKLLSSWYGVPNPTVAVPNAKSKTSKRVAARNMSIDSELEVILLDLIMKTGLQICLNPFLMVDKAGYNRWKRLNLESSFPDQLKAVPETGDAQSILLLGEIAACIKLIFQILKDLHGQALAEQKVMECFQDLQSSFLPMSWQLKNGLNNLQLYPPFLQILVQEDFSSFKKEFKTYIKHLRSELCSL